MITDLPTPKGLGWDWQSIAQSLLPVKLVIQAWKRKLVFFSFGPVCGVAKLFVEYKILQKYFNLTIAETDVAEETKVLIDMFRH